MLKSTKTMYRYLVKVQRIKTKQTPSVKTSLLHSGHRVSYRSNSTYSVFNSPFHEYIIFKTVICNSHKTYKQLK